MADLQRSNSVNNMDTAEVTSPEIVQENKKRKVNESDKNQLTLDSFNTPPPNKSNKPKPPTNKTIQAQLNKLFDKMDEIKSDIRKDLDQKLQNLVTTDELQKCVANIKEHFTDENEQLKYDMAELKDENETLKTKLAQVEHAARGANCHADLSWYNSCVALEKNDELEQHGRANSVRLYGVPDTDKRESHNATVDHIVDICCDKLGLNIAQYDIDIAHRLGVFDPTGKKPRGIICKFVRRTDKIDLLKAKSKIQSGISVYEDLTPIKRELLNKTKLKAGKKNAWSFNGNIMRALPDGKIIRVDSNLQTAIKNFEKNNPQYFGDGTNKSFTAGDVRHWTSSFSATSPNRKGAST